MVLTCPSAGGIERGQRVFDLGEQRLPGEVDCQRPAPVRAAEPPFVGRRGEQFSDKEERRDPPPNPHS